ncbi:hypothetical protein BDA96_03G005600 [Sorghum bicolor]|uniref:TF-B3 domain-containing protein n=4 Tax=Sorghum bicolor TaxID=4558 RepID=A0A921R961_SORBI|nr:B3 domain-containing protein Os01g0234100 isoform X2 [Sorghum bicolor]KAG0535745.1 hypothetical protein BDA96_03G005600 [Sorghum bicolor]KAG0535747.1 hypothetical protein BDA96_03G005600 [Sorghum bicolor]KAG0535748.1 hypothetical protein BDA96_03G005600 [Sorghum bicolor]KXG31471.1 hypothetical protein SORBI_3003G005500 [Sorghum bicolor]|eukprot:XP_021311371.1 B3 domain-containing protein Os01g0234100 isoform X2 [Sorghum bicolor]
MEIASRVSLGIHQPHSTTGFQFQQGVPPPGFQRRVAAEAMANDPPPPLKRKRGRPPGSKSAKSRIGSPPGEQSPQSKMEQKVALVKQRVALLDSASNSSCSDSDKPAVLHCGDTDDEGNYNLLKALKSRRLDSEQKKLSGALQAHNAQNIITGVTNIAEASDINGQILSASVHGNCGSAMARAKEVQAKLPENHLSFTKAMLPSHVIRGFWLGMPTEFCNKHLPKEDTGIMLEDENGEDHHTTYLGSRQGLSGGWRGFAIKHDIKVGDVLVFQLVESRKFKVYIIRANEFTATDGAISLLNLEARKKGKLLSKATRVEHSVPADDDNVVINKAGRLRISDSDMDFGDVTSFSDFSIIVDRLVIDCKFQEPLRRTYYELCRSQKAFLHRRQSASRRASRRARRSGRLPTRTCWCGRRPWSPWLCLAWMSGSC